MTKEQFIEGIKALYRVANASDSKDNASFEPWTKPEMASRACCRHLDRMLHDMAEAGAITQEERQTIYDTI